ESLPNGRERIQKLQLFTFPLDSTYSITNTAGELSILLREERVEQVLLATVFECGTVVGPRLVDTRKGRHPRMLPTCRVSCSHLTQVRFRGHRGYARTIESFGCSLATSPLQRGTEGGE